MAIFTVEEWDRLKSNPNFLNFFKYVKGYNFITNKPIEYIRKGKYVVEISIEQNHVMPSYIYGVTVVNTELGKIDNDLSTCFVEESKDTAYNKCKEYIDKLK